MNIQDVNQLYDIRISANERKSYKNSDSLAKLFFYELVTLKSTYLPRKLLKGKPHLKDFRATGGQIKPRLTSFLQF